MLSICWEYVEIITKDFKIDNAPVDAVDEMDFKGKILPYSQVETELNNDWILVPWCN